jgi:hypothetical protein
MRMERNVQAGPLGSLAPLNPNQQPLGIVLARVHARLLRPPLGFGAPELGREARNGPPLRQQPLEISHQRPRIPLGPVGIRPVLSRSSMGGLHPLDLLEQLPVKPLVFLGGKQPNLSYI